MVVCMVALVIQAQRVEVRYFHGKQRCITCRSMEKYAKEVLNESFAAQQKNKVISMKVIPVFRVGTPKFLQSYLPQPGTTNLHSSDCSSSIPR